jgi:hypothetical protein
VIINRLTIINPQENTMLRKGEGVRWNKTSAASRKYTPTAPPAKKRILDIFGRIFHLTNPTTKM